MLCGKFCSSAREALPATSIPVRVLFALERNGYTAEWRRNKHYRSCQNPLPTVQGIDYINCRFVWCNFCVAYRNIPFKGFKISPMISCEREHNTITTKPISLLFLFTKEIYHKAEHDNLGNKQKFLFHWYKEKYIYGSIVSVVTSTCLAEAHST